MSAVCCLLLAVCCLLSAVCRFDARCFLPPRTMTTQTLPTTRIDLTRRPRPLGRWLLTAAVLAYFGVLVLVPTVALVRGALAGGLGPFWDALTSPDARRAFRLTLGITLA